MLGGAAQCGSSSCCLRAAAAASEHSDALRVAYLLSPMQRRVPELRVVIEPGTGIRQLRPNIDPPPRPRHSILATSHHGRSARWSAARLVCDLSVRPGLHEQAHALKEPPLDGRMERVHAVVVRGLESRATEDEGLEAVGVAVERGEVERGVAELEEGGRRSAAAGPG